MNESWSCTPRCPSRAVGIWCNDLPQRREPQLIVAPKLKAYAVDRLAELPGVRGISVMGRQ